MQIKKRDVFKPDETISEKNFIIPFKNFNAPAVVAVDAPLSASYAPKPATPMLLPAIPQKSVNLG